MLVSGSVDVIGAVSKGTLNFMNMAIKPSSQIWFYMLQIWDDESDRSQSFGEIDSQEVKQKYKYTAALLHPRSADSHTHTHIMMHKSGQTLDMPSFTCKSQTLQDNNPLEKSILQSATWKPYAQEFCWVVTNNRVNQTTTVNINRWHRVRRPSS